MRMAAFMRRLARDSSGVTMVEYGLIVVVMALAIVSSLQWVANSSTSQWNEIAAQVQNAG